MEQRLEAIRQLLGLGMHETFSEVTVEVATNMVCDGLLDNLLVLSPWMD